MSTSLYEQAIIDAESLKQMAEENARNQVLEAITPQIRALVESEMLQEDSNKNLSEEKKGSCSKCGDHKCNCKNCPGCGGKLTEEGQCMESACNAADDSDDNDLLLDEEDGSGRVDEAELRALSLLVNSAADVHTREIAQRAHNLRKNLARYIVVKESFDMGQLDQESRLEFIKRFNDLMREGVILRREAIFMNEADAKQVQQLVDKTVKEMKVMSKSLDKTLLNRLFEAEGDEELALDVEDDVGGEESDMEMEDAGGVEVPEDLLTDPQVQQLLDLLGGAEGGEEEMEMELEEPAAEEPGEELSMEMDMYEADDTDDEEKNLEEVFEIDVNELRKELLRLQEGDAAEMADQFGGGEAVGDVVFEIDEDDLINVLADELGREDVPTPKVESRRRARKNSLQESRQNRALRSQLSEAKKAVSSLQEQLSGMNLFNAKLLYANKLMQNKGLTNKQQHAIVEALDNASTLEEAKLLYKSLTSALAKKRNSLSESKKLGSASKSTRPSGQPLNEGVGTTDRWAVLAGIKSKVQD